MLTSEKLRSTVLERENLREKDRILLNTFDMMTKYMDQIKESVGRNATVDKLPECEKCNFRSASMGELNEHKEKHHRVFGCFKSVHQRHSLC